MKCLLADDSKLARLSLVKALESHLDEMEIFHALNGAEALEIVEKESIDTVFLDLTMPVMDGYEAIPKLLEIKPDLNIVVVSADVQPKSKERVLDLGAKMHIKKPINAEKMEGILRELS